MPRASSASGGVPIGFASDGGDGLVRDSASGVGVADRQRADDAVVGEVDFQSGAAVVEFDFHGEGLPGEGASLFVPRKGAFRGAKRDIPVRRLGDGVIILPRGQSRTPLARQFSCPKRRPICSNPRRRM